MSVKAVRETIIQFFDELYDKFTKIIYLQQIDAEVPGTIEIVCTVPEYKMISDYQLIEESTRLLMHSEQCCVAQGNILLFIQRCVSGNNTVLDTEYAATIE